VTSDAASAPAVRDRAAPAAVGTSSGGRRGRRLAATAASLLGVVPFGLLVTFFLVIPTLVVVIGSFLDADNRFTLANVRGLAEDVVVQAYVRSLWISAVTALVGGVLGALLAHAISTANPAGVLRRAVTAACGVLAQFGGVTLAFAFLATFGFTGFVTVWLQTTFGVDPYGAGGWLTDIPGLLLVYTYFQIPLMVIVFLPALDGLRPQWREATESLGGTTYAYWRYVAGPVLLPSFLGGILLLFANAFSAYATAKALISQASPIVPLKIDSAISGEVVTGQDNIGKAMALGMVIIVAIVLWLYARLQRRTSGWLS
jgi:putative spermidine/putrescine transport system permease protein